MNSRWTQRPGGSGWGRAALMVPLAIALALGAGACESSSDGDGTPGGTDPSDIPGGKADNPNEVAFGGLTMQAMPEQPGRFDVARTPGGDWFFRLIGPGGDAFLTSGAYPQKISGVNAQLSVEENGVLLERYKVASIGPEECSFELRAANNQTIAFGPVFRDCAEADARIQATRDLVAGVLQYKAAVSEGARFDLWKEPSDAKWRFELRAEDRRVLLASQTYTSRTNAITGIESVRTNGKLSERYRVVAQQDGSVTISLRAANGQEIAQSGPYPAQEQADAVIGESVGLLLSERVGNPW